MLLIVNANIKKYFSYIDVKIQRRMQVVLPIFDKL